MNLGSKTTLLTALALLSASCKSSGETRTAAPAEASAAAPPSTAVAEGEAAPKKPMAPRAIAADLPPIPTSEAWRAQVPRGDAPRTPRLPKFESVQLKNGLTVMVSSERSTLPLVSFHLVTRGGSAMDPPGKAGLAAMTYAMLSEGAGKRDALQFSDAAADLGAEFHAGTDRDRGSASIGGLVKNADAMLALLADATLRPRMDAKEFERRRAQSISALVAARGSPQGLAFEALPAMVYGADHPYGHPPSGSPDTLKGIALEDVKAALPRIICPERSALIAAGAITLPEAVKLAERYFSAWKPTKVPMPVITAVPAKTRSEVVLLDKKNSPQTMVLIARPIFGRGDPDEAPTTVLNEIFGGAFTSRLNMNLREDKGYTYGAGSQTAFRLGAGVFVAYAAVRQDATAASVVEFMKELGGMTARPPTGEEVALAKAGLIRALPGAFERTSASAVAASSIFAYALPLDYYQKVLTLYGDVQPDAVATMAAKHLQPETMSLLLVGDADVIRPHVEALGLGKVVVRTAP